MYRPVQCYLWIYLSMQNDLSSTFSVLKSYLLCCCGLSHLRTWSSEYSVNTLLGSVQTYLLELKSGIWSAISSGSLLAGTCCSSCNRAAFKPDQTDRWNLLKWNFFSLKWGIKWNSFYPILPLASRKKGSVLPLSLRVQFCHLLPFHKLPLCLAIK